MKKIILTVGAAASLGLSLLLWRCLERTEIRAGEENEATSPGDWVEYKTLARNLPLHEICLGHEGDYVRVLALALELPRTGIASRHVQWETRCDGKVRGSSGPRPWRFWGSLGLIAAAPFLLSALVAGAVALASGRKQP